MASPGNRHCAKCIGALSFPINPNPNPKANNLNRNPKQ